MYADDARGVAAWHYRGGWSVYDLPSAQALLDDLDSYHVFTAVDADAVVGFCCTGAAARVPELVEDPLFVDVGLGMDPRMVGRGYGAVFGEAVLSHVKGEYPGRRLRAVIQSWNERSLRTTRRLGFTDAGELGCVQHGEQVNYRVVVTVRLSSTPRSAAAAAT
jgi:[ribosomal protein S18]-alanine N-acetyltransferase